MTTIIRLVASHSPFIFTAFYSVPLCTVLYCYERFAVYETKNTRVSKPLDGVLMWVYTYFVT